MRIIAGQYRGRVLKSPPSMQIRPTSDRLRETLFNVLAPRLADARFLDLCAGSGACGIEALSRGAAFATFVDRSRKTCGLIEANLDLLGVPEERTEVVMSEVADYLRRTAARALVPYDIAYFDPPYSADYLLVLELFGLHADALLAPDGVLVVEHHHKNTLRDAIGQIRRWRILKQGDSALSFYERN
ncbi:MAG: 16S rRNA (guanine(966)-N(2))-methyltransferase RsmD [Acidobacteria bacterium]|nr:MAG: 16S rRNA (guanine(966)-N(2))-methyltransferase RsmD [Acidobacteriota bacterium]